MEFTNTEVSVIEQASAEAAQLQTQELNDLQLAFVGGGNIITMIG
jgi:hypothetical protein